MTASITSDTQKLQLRDEIIQLENGKTIKFEIVGLLEDADNNNNNFAIGFSSEHDLMIVTDIYGTLIGDDTLAQEILDEFMVLAEQSTSDG